VSLRKGYYLFAERRISYRHRDDPIRATCGKLTSLILGVISYPYERGVSISRSATWRSAFIPLGCACPDPTGSSNIRISSGVAKRCMRCVAGAWSSFKIQSSLSVATERHIAGTGPPKPYVSKFVGECSPQQGKGMSAFCTLRNPAPNSCAMPQLGNQLAEQAWREGWACLSDYIAYNPSADPPDSNDHSSDHQRLEISDFKPQDSS